MSIHQQFPDVPCDLCNLERAAYYVVDVSGGKEYFYCPLCVQKVDLLSGAAPMPPNLLGVQSLASQKCPSCNWTWGEFLQHQRLGCAKCYDVFNIAPVIKDYHKTDAHMGKVPRSYQVANADRQIRLLRKALEEAVKRENYEAAAILRDKINMLNKEMSK